MGRNDMMCHCEFNAMAALSTSLNHVSSFSAACEDGNKCTSIISAFVARVLATVDHARRCASRYAIFLRSAARVPRPRAWRASEASPGSSAIGGAANRIVLV